MAARLGHEPPLRQAGQPDAPGAARLWLRAWRAAAAGAPTLLGGPMSVHGNLPRATRRKGEIGRPGRLPQAAAGGELRVGEPGQRPGDLPAGPLGGPRAAAAQPSSGARSAGALENPLLAIGDLRAG